MLDRQAQGSALDPPGAAAPGPITHVIGAGLAGLAAALELVDAGRAVVIHESSAAAGGRCRSYYDRQLECRLDNGNHLLLSGNRAAAGFIERIGARGSFIGPAGPIFPFLDRQTGQRWTLRLSRGRIPWWMLDRKRRVPDTSLPAYLRLRHLVRPRPGATVAQTMAPDTLFRRLIEPLAIAGLNTEPDQASAELFAAIIGETLMQGGGHCIPSFPRIGLSESLVDPAVAALAAAGARFRFSHRVAGLGIEGERVAALHSAEGTTPLGPADSVVLAVPAPAAAALLPGLVVPDAFRAILNIHFRMAADPGEAGFIGLVGGTAEWVFVKPGIVSVTISAADRRVDQPAEAIAALVWPDVAAACALPPTPMPAWRVVKEKRATFAATPAQERRRPAARTGLANLVLAGDWTATGLPATIEGAIRSAHSAAAALLQRKAHSARIDA